MIINMDIEFKEYGAWDGGIDKTISIGGVVPQVGDEEKEKNSHGGKQGLKT